MSNWKVAVMVWWTPKLCPTDRILLATLFSLGKMSKQRRVFSMLYCLGYQANLIGRSTFCAKTPLRFGSVRSDNYFLVGWNMGKRPSLACSGDSWHDCMGNAHGGAFYFCPWGIFSFPLRYHVLLELFRLLSTCSPSLFFSFSIHIVCLIPRG